MVEETPELVQVLQELGPGFIRWHPLGLFLRIPLDQLNAIKATEHDVLNQTIQMLERWYANKSPTWRALCKALRDVSHPSLADRISVQYCRVPQQEVQQPTSAAPSGVREPLKGDEGEEIQPFSHDHPRPPIQDGRRGEDTGIHPLTSNEPPHPPRQDRGNEQQQRATASLPSTLEDTRICDLDEEGKCKVSMQFAVMFVAVVQLLNKILPVDTLKLFLDSFRHSMNNLPYVNSRRYKKCKTTQEVLKSLHPHHINSRRYKKCKTTQEVLKSLHPHHINPMNMFLLRKIVDTFGNDKVKQQLESYDKNFPQSLPIKRLGNPLTDEEMANCTSAKRVKVVKDGDGSRITKREVEEVRKALARYTRTDLEAIIFAQLSDQSVAFIFLVPEGVVSLFSDLRSDQQRLYSLAAIGILRIETEETAIDVSYESQLCSHKFAQLSLRERTEMGSTLSLDNGYFSEEGDIPPSASSRDHQLAMEFAADLRADKTAPTRE